VYRYTKFLYYKTLNKLPRSLSDKVYAVRRLRLGPYDGAPSAEISTVNVTVAINKLKYALSVDYDKEYAVPDMTGMTSSQYRCVHNWYSVNGRYIENTLLEEWLDLAVKCEYNRSVGINKPTGDRAYMNSIRLTPLVDEAMSILDAILMEYGFV